MPIQKVNIKGETFYRYGDHGTLYKTLDQALTQMRAMFANGYRPSSGYSGHPGKK